MRHVRNAWATITCEGRELATGPKRKDGGLSVEVKLRKNGAVAEDSYSIYVREEEGEIVSRVYYGNNRIHETRRPR